jgi:hypothetical protein
VAKASLAKSIAAPPRLSIVLRNGIMIYVEEEEDELETNYSGNRFNHGCADHPRGKRV